MARSVHPLRASSILWRTGMLVLLCASVGLADSGGDAANYSLTPFGDYIYTATATIQPEQLSCCLGRVGDANGDGGDEPTLADIAIIIDAKFITGTCDGVLPCYPEADVSQSGGIDPACRDITIGDISTLINYLFITGPSLGLPDCLLAN